jgi:transcription initiation factor IIE alpha subunit
MAEPILDGEPRRAAPGKDRERSMSTTYYCCTHCDWSGSLEEAEDDYSLGHADALCPECFSHIEPMEDSAQSADDQTHE